MELPLFLEYDELDDEMPDASAFLSFKYSFWNCTSIEKKDNEKDEEKERKKVIFRNEKEKPMGGGGKMRMDVKRKGKGTG